MSLDLSSSFHQFRISMADGSKSGTLAFDNFRFDVGNLMLYRDGEEVLIAPKIARTLAVLIEGAGNIISKDELIERVWDDSIVEEANLTQYLYILRKTLGKMPDGRPYIETLRRRGYRFNATVRAVSGEPRPASSFRKEPEVALSYGGVEREGNVLRVVDWKPEREADVSNEDRPALPEPEAKREPADPRTIRSGGLRLAIAAAAALLFVVGGGGITFFWPRLMPSATSVPARAELSIVRLTNGAFPHSATISHDGNYFAYHEVDGDTARMFVQQVGQTSRIEIVTSVDKVLHSKTFSPDGRHIYYVTANKSDGSTSLNRVPTIGGAPTKVLDDIHGIPSFSPDGKEIVFCRLSKTSGESVIVIAAEDGRAERVLLRPGSVLGGSPAWSPDGKLIAYSEQDMADPKKITVNRISLINVATGEVTRFSEEGWDTVYRMMWTPEGDGIVFVGTRQNDAYSTRRDQVYYLAYPSGISHRITTDGNRHDGAALGVTRDGAVLAVSGNRSSQIWAMNRDSYAANAIQITKGAADGRSGLEPLPDGRIAYLARTAEEINIMISNADGSDAKQLPSGFQFLEELRADPLGRFFVFSTVKDGLNQLFRIDADGSNVRQLTFGEGRAIDSSISPDGRYIVYDEVVYRNNVPHFSVRKIPSEGGNPVQLGTIACVTPIYSPDGSLLSCVRIGAREILVLSASDGAELERHPLPTYATWNFGISWTPDGSGLVYIVTQNDASNLWVQPRSGSKPEAMTNFSSGVIYRYAFVPDSSKLYLARGYPVQDAVLIRNIR
jgi:Tol biopolymer transport system component/DNA-binding winged helix-turn-helix (wHTH) protein